MNRNHQAVYALIATALAAAAVTAGCGDAPQAEAQADAAPAAVEVAPAGAEPTDNGARTHQGLYLTAEQAQALGQRLEQRLVTVQAHCCGPEASELDVLMAFGVQAAANLANDAPFVVNGSDLRQAAAVANRLSALGARQVYLVTR